MRGRILGALRALAPGVTRGAQIVKGKEREEKRKKEEEKKKEKGRKHIAREVNQQTT